MQADQTGWSAARAFLLVATAALLMARIPVLGVRFFDPDEFEHAHAAWSVSKGLLPYRDFFEHHTPWYYFALSPFFRWFAVDQSFEAARRFLLFARGLSVVLTALSAVLVFAVGRLGANRTVGLLAALFFAGQPVVIQKTMEIRPDVLALPFFVAGLWFLLRGLAAADDRADPPPLRWFLGGGLCVGGAVMCTQKMLFVLPGALAGLALWAFGRGRRPARARLARVLLFLVGVALPLAATWAAFAARGGGAVFIRDNFLLNARWKMHSARHLGQVLGTSWPILVPCAVGMFVSLRRFLRAGQRRHGDVLLLCTFAGLAAGLAIVPAAYRQYYLPPLAIACLFAAQGLWFLVEQARERARPWVLVGATLPLLVWPVVDLGRSFGRTDDRQTARLRYVFAHTTPADPVLDGWLGTGVFRPHPLYYFFMHRELLVMLTDAEKAAYVGALESGRVRPALIALDDELIALGPRFLRFVRDHYVSDDGLFYAPAPRQSR